jgi:tetratricopeptide (TPR) repeat protein
MGLAAELVKTAPASLRDRIYQRVLDLDAENEAALLCRAADFERQGKAAEAVSTLERLLRSHPGNSEARLRLALNTRRLGDNGKAKWLLQDFVKGTPEPWQLAIAYQELGRMLVADGDLEAAERTLREGLKLLPDDEKLALQLAMVHELRKSPEQAREALQALRPATGESARRRYSRIPTELLDEVWSTLERAADERRASLAAALGSVAP